MLLFFYWVKMENRNVIYQGCFNIKMAIKIDDANGKTGDAINVIYRGCDMIIGENLIGNHLGDYKYIVSTFYIMLMNT